MRPDSNGPGGLSILVATLSMIVAAVLNAGLFRAPPMGGMLPGFDYFLQAVAVGFVGGIISVVLAARGFRRSGARSWTNWIGLTLSLVPLLCIAALVLMFFLNH